MKQLSLVILLVAMAHSGFSQTPEELNQQARDLLLKQDYKNAVVLLKQAAEKGMPEAQYNLAICYQQGVEVEKNDSIANSWLLQAAKAGYASAQFKIAYSYAAGRGFVKDDQAAFYWSLKCAGQEDTECMFNVIGCYMNGTGTKRNLDSMLFWARRLALLPNPEDLEISGRITSARANLADLYKEGKLIQQDLVISYAWLLLYNESKRDFSMLVQQEKIESIQAIEKELTTGQKAKSRQLAEEWMHRKLTNGENLYKTEFQ